jgi:CheY-like chemotaxis protein
MRLEFRLLVVDDNPESVDEAIAILSDHLDTKGFSLNRRVAADLSERGLRDLARLSGKDYDLVIIDYNLGRVDTNGAVAAARMRRELQYTDIIFYSTDPSLDLFQELAKEQVAGVFVAGRLQLSDALTGLADTVIGKAVDLNHMRGIAMAEVAEMDVLMEETLERVFASADPQFAAKAAETLKKLQENADRSAEDLKPLVRDGRILDIVGDSRLFPSAHKYMTIRRVAKCLQNKPTTALTVLQSYEADIIHNRNTLAHAKEDMGADGTTTLRSIKRGQPAVNIDDNWMVAFRGKLKAHRAALITVCNALGAHLDAMVPTSDAK